MILSWTVWWLLTTPLYEQACNRMKRFLDIILSLIGILLFLPFAFLIAVWIKVDSHGPVLYRQKRVGKYGREFMLFKFRTMAVHTESQGLLTIGKKDRRITRAGYLLRKFKVDELPQLINVLIGEMSMVGPRPEVKKYVDLYTEEQRSVLKVKPGITDWASIMYRNENELLARSANPEQTYIQVIMPDKIRLNMEYIKHPSVGNYFRITFKTLHLILKR